MRRLLLLRHAKAVPTTGRHDFERALVERGRRDAERVGAFVAEAGLIPDLIVFSAAARTRETATLVLKAWPRPVAMLSEPALYDASRAGLQAIVRALPAASASVMLVGHNPGVAELALSLAGRGAKSDMLRLAGKFSTSALAVLEFDADDWREASAGAARLARFVTPDDLSVASD
jgi:phosphohistidine phosphatase